MTSQPRRHYARKSSRPIVDPTIGLDPGVTQVWTDGSASPNPGPGGWGWVTPDGRTGSGGSQGARSTNQRMEITAALDAVRSIPERPLAVVTDSAYVADAMNKQWWKGWLSRGWKNSTGADVANRDLWEPFFDLVVFGGVSVDENPLRQPVDSGVRFLWVKGHADFALNEAADRLANAGRVERLVSG